MSFIITFLAALFVFGAVIAIHEFGHFAVAKLCGVQVNEFSIGMGPALWHNIYHGTQYSLRLFPVGGYVALEGEESPESQQAENLRDTPEPPLTGEMAARQPERFGKPLNEAAVWQRMLVMAAGAFMNFVLGFVVLVLLISARNEPITSRVIYKINEGALCGQTGLEAGDKVLAVNGRRCFVANDMIYELVRAEQYRADFTVLRDGKTVELPDVQFDTWVDDSGETHMSLGFTVYGIQKTPLNVLKEAGNSVLYYGRIIYTSLAEPCARAGEHQRSFRPGGHRNSHRAGGQLWLAGPAGTAGAHYHQPGHPQSAAVPGAGWRQDRFPPDRGDHGLCRAGKDPGQPDRGGFCAVVRSDDFCNVQRYSPAHYRGDLTKGSKPCGS